MFKELFSKNKTIFVEKSYIVATLLNVKNNYFDECFVDFKELNYLTSCLQKYFNDNNMNVIITDEIDQNYFSINDVIVLNKLNDTSMQSIINQYQGNFNVGD